MANRIGPCISTFLSTNRCDQEDSQILKLPLEIISRIGQLLVPREQANFSSTCFHAMIYVGDFNQTNLFSLKKEIHAALVSCNTNKAKAALMPQISALLEKMTLQNTKEVKAKSSVLLYEFVSKLPSTELKTLKAKESPAPAFWGLDLSTLAHINSSLVAATHTRKNDLPLKIFKFITTCSEFIPLQEMEKSLKPLQDSFSNFDPFEFFITVIEKLCQQGRVEEAEILFNFVQEDFLQNLAGFMLLAFRAVGKQFVDRPVKRFDGLRVNFCQKLFAPIQSHLQQLWEKKMKEGDLTEVIKVATRMENSLAQLTETARIICKDIDQNTHTTHFQDNKVALEDLCLHLLKSSCKDVGDYFLRLDIFHEGKIFALKFCETLAKNKRYKEAFKFADRIPNIWVTQDAFYIIIDLALKDSEVSSHQLIEALGSIRSSLNFFDNFQRYRHYDAFSGWVQYIKLKKALQYAKSFLPAWFSSREKDSS